MGSMCFFSLTPALPAEYCVPIACPPSATVTWRTDHVLLPTGSVALQRLDLSGKGPGKLVEGTLGTVLLWDVLDVRQAPGKGDRREMHSRHLCGQHCFDLVLRLNALAMDSA